MHSTPMRLLVPRMPLGMASRFSGWPSSPALRLASVTGDRELIGRLRSNGDAREIAALLKEDGALSLRLLRYVNSAANAQTKPIASIEHAFALLGEERLYRWLVLLAVMLAFLPVVIDMTILHIAVPSLTQALGASATEVLWIIDIYPLLMAGLLVSMGTLADRIGNRRLLLTGLVIFGVSSLLAAFAPTPAMLIGARVLLALGGAMIMPCVLGTISRTFEDQDERAMALGLWHANTKKPISIND